MAADDHLGMTALSRVTMASAGLSCLFRYFYDALFTLQYSIWHFQNLVYWLSTDIQTTK